MQSRTTKYCSNSESVVHQRHAMAISDSDSMPTLSEWLYGYAAWHVPTLDTRAMTEQARSRPEAPESYSSFAQSTSMPSHLHRMRPKLTSQGMHHSQSSTAGLAMGVPAECVLVTTTESCELWLMVGNEHGVHMTQGGMGTATHSVRSTFVGRLHWKAQHDKQHDWVGHAHRFLRARTSDLAGL